MEIVANIGLSDLSKPTSRTAGLNEASRLPGIRRNDWSENPELVALAAPMTDNVGKKNDDVEMRFDPDELVEGALIDEFGKQGLDNLEQMADKFGLDDSIMAGLPKEVNDEFNAIVLNELNHDASAIEAVVVAFQELLPEAPELRDLIAKIADKIGYEPQALIERIESTDPAVIAANAELVFAEKGCSPVADKGFAPVAAKIGFEQAI